MAFENVSPAAAVWQTWGLAHILMPQDVRLAGARAAAGCPLPSRSPVSTAQAAARGAAREEFARPAASSARRPAAQAAPVRVEQKSAPVSFAHCRQAKPLEQWSEPWRKLFARTRKGLFGWTYWDLGADLLAVRDADDAGAAQRKGRGQVMTRLLRELGHPAGTHTFWPPWLVRTENQQPDTEMFWSGLKLLGCRGVLIFGSRAARALIPRPGLGPLMQFRENGFQVWIIKDLAGLEQDQSHYAQMLIVLKEGLKHFIRK